MVGSRVVVVAADSRFADAVRVSMEDGEEITVCLHTDDGGEAIELTRTHRPLACLVDLDVVGSGVDVIGGIRRSSPSARIVALGSSGESRDVFEAVVAGARGYLTKPCEVEEVVDAVHRLITSELALSPRLVLTVLDHLEVREAESRQLAKARQLLTDREVDALELLACGSTTRQVADALSISPATVRSHVAAIVRKLGVGDRDAAIEWWLEAGGW